LKLISTLRRIVSPIPRKMKSQEFRMLHNTQWGYFCPNETPEGQSTGIVKTMSMLCTISIGEDPIIVIDHIKKMGLVPHISKAYGQTEKEAFSLYIE